MRGLDQLEELHRPWIDEVDDHVQRVRGGGQPHPGGRRRLARRRHRPVLDARLAEPGVDRARLRDGRRRHACRGPTCRTTPTGRSGSRPTGSRRCASRSGSGSTRSSSCRSRSSACSPFKAVLGYEKMLDEHGREMHGSWGNMIDAEEAFDRMGADVMRWQYCQQPPDRNLLFGYGPAHEIKRRLLTFWNSVRFLVDSANTEGFSPRYGESPRADDGPLDRWLVARTAQLVADATQAYEDFLTHRVVDAFEAYVVDLSTWYIRRSRRRFYSYDEAAFSTLWASVVTSLRVIAPVAPFLAEHLWQNLVRERLRGCAGVGLPRRLARAGRAGRGRAGGGRRGAPDRRARPPGARRGGHRAAPAAAADVSCAARRSPARTSTSSRAS